MQYYQPQPQPYYYQPQPMPPYLQEQLRTQQYKRELRRTINGLGGLLLAFFGLEIIIVVILELILTVTGNLDDLMEMNVLYMLESGLISSIVFFVTGAIYCLIRKADFGAIFPFQKIGGAMLYRLCVIGISFSLMSNYVVDLLNNNLGLFGIENNGGSFDTSDNPDVLMYILVVAVIPAFVEEFAFRGVVMGILRPYSEGLAILVSSAAFAFMHGNFVQMPFTFCCGLVFAYIDIKSNSLLPSIIVHFLNNGLSVLYDIVVSYGVLSESQASLCYGAVFVVTGILAFFAIRHIVMHHDSDYYNLKGGDDVIPFRLKLRTAVTSPTMICFAAVMVAYSVYELILGMS